MNNIEICIYHYYSYHIDCVDWKNFNGHLDISFRKERFDTEPYIGRSGYIKSSLSDNKYFISTSNSL